MKNPNSVTETFYIKCKISKTESNTDKATASTNT